MIVLTLEPGEAEKLAESRATCSRSYGMPIDAAPYSRPASSSLPAERSWRRVCSHLSSSWRCSARLRVRVMVGGLLDDPELIAAGRTTSAWIRPSSGSGANEE